MSQENIAEIQKALVDQKLIIGTDKVMKGLKNGEIATVFVTINAPEIVKSDIEHYAKLSGANIAELDETNEELGEICKKRFSISLVATIK